MQALATQVFPHSHPGALKHGRLPSASVEDLPQCFSSHGSFEMTQLDAGESCCDLEFVCGPGAGVCHMLIARQSHLRGTMRPGWFVVGLVREAGEHGSYQARLRFGWPGRPFDWFLRGGESLLLVMVDRDKFGQLATEARALPGVLDYLRNGDAPAFWTADPRAVRGAAALLLGLLEAAESGQLDGSGDAFGQSVFEALLGAVDGACEVASGENSAVLLVDRARQLVGSMPKRFRVSDLCAALRVSPRTLHGAFIAVTGVGPHAFFLRQRLNAARHQLAKADPGRVTVTNVALELGFTELGRFAGRYRAFFGESPSQTLQRPRRHFEPVPV